MDRSPTRLPSNLHGTAAVPSAWTCLEIAHQRNQAPPESVVCNLGASQSLPNAGFQHLEVSWCLAGNRNP